MDDIRGMRRFGPMGVWFLVLVPDLALTGWWVAMMLEGMLTDGQGNFAAADSGGLVLPCAVLALSPAGTWWALLGRGHHPQTVRAAIAVSLLRLVLLALFTGMPVTMD